MGSRPHQMRVTKKNLHVGTTVPHVEVMITAGVSGD